MWKGWASTAAAITTGPSKVTDDQSPAGVTGIPQAGSKGANKVTVLNKLKKLGQKKVTLAPKKKQGQSTASVTGIPKAGSKGANKATIPKKPLKSILKKTTLVPKKKQDVVAEIATGSGRRDNDNHKNGPPNACHL